MFVRSSIILLSLLLVYSSMGAYEPRNRFGDIIRPSSEEICNMCLDVCQSSREGDNFYVCYHDICKCDEMHGKDKELMGEMSRGLEETDPAPTEAQPVPADASERTRKPDSLL
jgi:hypothetical protein